MYTVHKDLRSPRPPTTTKKKNRGNFFSQNDFLTCGNDVLCKINTLARFCFFKIRSQKFFLGFSFFAKKRDISFFFAMYSVHSKKKRNFCPDFRKIFIFKKYLQRRKFFSKKLRSSRLMCFYDVLNVFRAKIFFSIFFEKSLCTVYVRILAENPYVQCT